MTQLNIPAEWAPHKAIWTCWPSAADLWQEDLVPARAEVAAMIRALAASTPSGNPGDVVHVLAHGDEAIASARASLPSPVHIHACGFGDIWLRDTGPIFAKRDGKAVALRFAFNGWGGKYDLPFDDSVGDRVAEAAATTIERADFILEGGAVDHDGEGTILTTRQCLLNPNRNAGWTEAVAEAHLRAALGAKKVLWLGDGLANDHTDGHVDNIARFVGPGRVMCMSPFGDDDPNREVLNQIAADLRSMKDAAGRSLEVIQIPSPGLVTDDEREAIPASHMNFIIGNASVVMPHYGTPSADAALRGLAAAFPHHRVVGIQSTAILTGGGSFHCITQQEPV
ncbi:agmatine deiminase family protein [Aquidulcibacter sp.]|uniref:agmatine deiminase family protein n=1 Tax=Aquidulcibacter sp. TaxID=2052990 RepID=UPI0025BE916D|nr:agmatine deiminase family protein [Aquidulcibacter sp.]MCA3691842.1 agmatine deiminase family protein [Aquidulcibacter sp.]